MRRKFKKEQLKLFFYWISERERIRQKKEDGVPWPWTNDQIMRTYKFTNAFRKKDRTTVDLLERTKNTRDELELYTRICFFRLFNWTPTFDICQPYLAKGTDFIYNILRQRKEQGEQIWTGAYMIHADPGHKVNKIQSYLDTYDAMHHERATTVAKLLRHNSLQFATEYMQRYNHVGAFIAYELACDFSYYKALLLKCTDRYTWANTGPGAARGIHRLLWETDKKLENGVDYVAEMQTLLEISPDWLKPWVPRLEMRDIEHSLCEFDKYSRVYNEEGRRPKQKYQPPKEPQ